MKFRVTSVACTESGAQLNDVTVQLEDALNAALGNTDFGDGVDQFAVVIISVDDDILENEKYAKSHNKLGSFKKLFTNEKVKFLSFALEISPSNVMSKNSAGLLAFVSQSIIELLQSRPKRLPKGFNYAQCCSSITSILSVYAK